jgi:hypothetical protein
MNIHILEYLEEEEIKQLIEDTPTLQRKQAFIVCMCENGPRHESGGISER